MATTYTILPNGDHQHNSHVCNSHIPFAYPGKLTISSPRGEFGKLSQEVIDAIRRRLDSDEVLIRLALTSSSFCRVLLPALCHALAHDSASWTSTRVMRVATDGEDWSISRRQVTDVKIAVDPRHVAICDIGMQYRRASSPIDPEERAALAFRPVLISSSNISADEIPFTRRPRLSALRLDLIHSDAKLLDRLLYKLTTQYDFRSKSVIRNLVTRKYVRGTPFLVRDIRLWFIADPDQVSRTWPVDFAEARERIGSAGRWVGCRFDVVDESEVEGRSEWADVSNEMIGSSGGEVLSDEGQREGVI